MRRFRFAALTLGCLAAAGCMEFDTQQPPDAFKAPFNSTPPPALTPASTEVAARVDLVGRRIIAANPQIGARPMFATIGAPQPEIFHRGTSDVYVTEGLVKQCSTDGQLAALLCSELGKLVAEREALSPPQVRRPERPPPIDVPIGNAGNPADASDLTRVRELADYDEDRKRRFQPVPPPDPAVLTRTYLLRAGYHDDDLVAAGPLLLNAQNNGTFEKQMRAPAPGSPPALGAPLPTTPAAPGGF